MFADSMLETSWAQRARRSWTTLTSFGLQALAISLLLLLPLWKTVGLPSARTVSTPVSLGRVAVDTAARPANQQRSSHASHYTFPADLCSLRAYHPSSKRDPTISAQIGDDRRVASIPGCRRNRRRSGVD